MHESERARHRLERGRDRGVTARRGLKLRQRTTNVVQRDVRVRRELIGALDLVQGPHRLGDGSSEVDEVGRHARIALQSIESARERFACRL
jgi:hypothetical protein